MLKINNIVKVFEDKKTQTRKTVLNNISIEIKSGEVYGLIGANGAGKTTLMNIISQMLPQTSGTIEIDSRQMNSLNDLSGKVGYMLDIPSMHEFMTAYEYFAFLASPQNLSKETLLEVSEKLLKEVGLQEVGRKKIKNFSRGMKQRMGIAAALISEPDIILMDEPSSALDPQGRYEVVQIIDSLRQKGKTIILSTHILNDVERVCDRVGLLHGGKIVIEGRLTDVLARFAKNAFVVEGADTELQKVEKVVRKSEVFTDAKFMSSNLIVCFADGGKDKMFKTITAASDKLNGVYIEMPTMEDIFLKVSGGEV